MIIIKNADKTEEIKELVKDFEGKITVQNQEIQIEFDSDYTQMQQPLVNALMRLSIKLTVY